MTTAEYIKLMHDDGVRDGSAHLPMKYQDVIAYAIGYAEGEAK